MSKYIVITGDVIESKEYDNINNLLKLGLQNIKYPDNVITPFRISRGDEIQTVFKGKIKLAQFLRRVRYLLRPLEIRFGIGFGDIKDNNDKDISSWSMNGSAFHNAREVLTEIEKEEIFKSKLKSGSSFDEAINTILFLIDTIQEDWTDSQWEAIYYYDIKGTYEKAAKVLNIAFQNVEKRCKAANWKEVKYAEQSINNILCNIL